MMDYGTELGRLAMSNEDIIVMTAENRAPIRDLPDLLGNRFIDTGITEQCMVGAAAGLALRGRRVVAHALSSFLVMRAFEFIRTDIGVPKLPVKLVGFVPGFLSDANGPTHQGIEDVSLMRGIPGMNIFCPKNINELAAHLEEILETPEPFYIRYPKLIDQDYSAISLDWSTPEQLSDGNDVTILSYGHMTNVATEALEMLSADGISCCHLHVKALKPINWLAIQNALERTPITFIIEDHFRIGGLYSIVAENLLALNTTYKVISLSLNDCWFKPGRLPEAINQARLSANALTDRIKQHLEV